MKVSQMEADFILLDNDGNTSAAPNFANNFFSSNKKTTCFQTELEINFSLNSLNPWSAYLIRRIAGLANP